MKRRFQIIGLSFGWFALIAQLVLTIQNREIPLLEAAMRYFGYFTILTNILVALYFTAAVVNSENRALHIFHSPSAKTAITAFIGIVGIVYHAILRDLWHPNGFQLLADQLLHTVMPLYMLMYWLFTIQKSPVKIKSVFVWLCYPVIYLLATLASGHFTGFYPYPFLNVTEIGISHVLRNIGFVAGATVLMMIILIVIQTIFRRFIKLS